jgi:hypothetical protein
MNLPPLQGTLDQPGFFIYAAADADYFDTYGIPLINSVTKNTTHGVHIHIYNPRPDQLELCHKTDRVSVSWETFDSALFHSAVNFWSRTDLPEPYVSRRTKMLGIKVVDRSLPLNANLEIWLRKTYYACVRFIRLAELLDQARSFLAIDVDGLVRKPFVFEFAGDKDFYLHAKEKGGHLAGALLATTRPACLNFVKQLANDIQVQFEKDNIYWFLDQNCLDNLVNRYNKGLLPMTYIDWNMDPTSAIWSAKGKRKYLNVFLQELKSYQS